jgi:hypothetical protein
LKKAVWCQKFEAIMCIEDRTSEIKMVTLDLQTKFSIRIPEGKKVVKLMDIDYCGEGTIVRL